MFFDEKAISALLVCPACKLKLVNPKLLSCCKTTVCSNCVQEMRNTRRTLNGASRFDCSLCGAKLPIDQSFDDNFLVQQFLSMQPSKVSRGKLADQLQQNLCDLSEQVETMETAFSIGVDKINELCSQIRNEVDISFEKVTQDIQEYRLKMIADIDYYQTQTVHKFKEAMTNTQMRDFKSLIEKSRENLQTWSAYLSQHVIDDKLTETSAFECRSLTSNAKRELGWFNNAVFSNRFPRFHCNPNKIQSDLIGSLEFYRDPQYIFQVSCDKTFEGNEQIQHSFVYLKSTNSDQCDYRNDKLAVFSTEADKTNSLHIWSIDQNKHLGELRGHTYTVNRVKQVDKDRMLSCSSDGTIKLWNLQSFECVRTFNGHITETLDIEILGEDKFASCSSGGGIRVWKMDCPKAEYYLGAHSAPVQILKLWQKKLISCSSDKQMKYWCLKEGLCLQTYDLPHAPFCVELISDDRAVVAFDNHTMEMYNLERMEMIEGSKMSGHTGKINRVNKLSDKFIISGSNDCTVKIWNIETFQCIFSLSEHAKPVKFIQVLSNDLFMTCSIDKVAKIWRIS